MFELPSTSAIRMELSNKWLQQILESINSYISEDLSIVPMLKMLRDSGRATFLVTNSLWDYTNAVMNILCQYTPTRHSMEDCVHGMALSSAQAAMIRKKPWKEKDHYEILHRESIGSDLPFPLVVPLRMPLVSDSARSGSYTGSHAESDPVAAFSGRHGQFELLRKLEI